MRPCHVFAACVIVGFGVLSVGSAHAQGGRAAYSAGRQGMSGQGETPFSNIYRRPAVSPYQNIVNMSTNPQMFQNVYQSMVQPALQQQQQAMEQLAQRRQMGRLQNQVTQIQRDTISRQIDESIRPTGHRATYMNYSHFYPQ